MQKNHWKIRFNLSTFLGSSNPLPTYNNGATGKQPHPKEQFISQERYNHNYAAVG